MYVRVDLSKKQHPKPNADRIAKKETRQETAFEILDQRPEAAAQRKMRQAADHSTRLTAQRLKIRQMSAGAPVQRIKIKLKDEDPILMDRLRDVQIPNQGNETLNDPTQANTAQQIGINENIILEGHGYVDYPVLGMFGTPEVVSQGGIPPARLAAIAHRVSKPLNWNGHIILLGCSTGAITTKVSQEYFKLTNAPVEVIGTEKNIKVGSTATGANFVGSEWDKYPVDQRPGDLAFVKEVQAANAAFIDAVQDFVKLLKELDQFKKGQIKAITINLAPLEAKAKQITDIDNTSAKPQIPLKNYKKAERDAMWRMFKDTVDDAKNVDFFVYPDKVQAITDPIAEGLQFNIFKSTFNILSTTGMVRYKEVEFYLLGLTLKQIDLFDKAQSKHSKQERTKKSLFGDTWVERA